MSQLKKYRRLKYLGKGSYGAAILVELRSNPSQRFVIKEIVIGHLKPAEQAAARSEAEVLHQMNHSNITMYIESFVENAKLYIVMENADGGDLSAAIQNRRKEMKYWEEEEVMRIFVQICLALKHVHGQNILHRDLKSQNIFLTQKGVVKLGDFGIAKVLDATDDQARTQIGTPYYLSPEICESKPYGRESDVWSLGVLLYELLALEMPFQATSLPALVHRICVAEPNYSVIDKRYSANLINLTKSMLMKDPQKRPSVAQVVKSDFIKTHISRLLSYTLKVGNGGVEGGNLAAVLPPSVRPSNVHNLNAEEAEKCIESVHSQIRDQESKEVRSQSNREAARIAEREKLRKFRNDMARAGRRDVDAEVLAPEEGKDGDGRVPYRPAPRVVVPGQRNMSPKAGGARPLSPKAGGVRPLSPKAGGARPLSPKGRDMSPKAPIPRNMSPKAGGRNNNVSPVNQRAGAGVSSNGRDGALTPRSRAAAQAPSQAQKERDAKVAAAAAMKQGFAREESGYERRDARPAQPQQQLISRNGSSHDDYVEIARREFFANRAAAQAVKAKVEAYNRNGGERRSMGMVGGGGGGAYAAGPAASSAGGPMWSNPTSRRNSDADNYSYVGEESSQYQHNDGLSEAERRIAQIKAQREKEKERENAMKEQELKEALEVNRDMLRKQGARSAIAFEIDLSGGGPPVAMPKVRNSGVRQSLEGKAVPSPPAASPSVGANANAVPRTRRDEKDSASTPPPTESDSGKGRTKRGWGPPVAAGDIAKGVVRYSEYSTPVSQMFAPPARESRGGGGGAVVAEDQYFDEDAAAGRGGAHRRDFSRDSIDAPPSSVEEDTVVLQRLESKRMSQMQVRQQAKEVFKKLREKRRSEAMQKGHRPSHSDAKAVEHSVVSPVKRPNPEEAVPRIASSSPLQQQRLMEVLESVDAAKESVQKAIAGGDNANGFRLRDPARSRSNSEVQAAAPSPSNGGTPSRRQQSVGGGAETPSRKPPIAAAAARHAAEVRDVQALDQHISSVQEGDEEDDLGYTLENWLTQQKRFVTQRKKPVHGAKDTDDEDAVEDSVDGYHTLRKGERMYDSQAKDGGAEEVFDDRGDFYISGTYPGYRDDGNEDNGDAVGVAEEDNLTAGDSEDVVRGKYMGNDVEVVGLQCMLAKALMGDGDEDD